MDTIKFPMSFDKGRIGYLVEGTREYYAQALSLAIQIRPGELPLEPVYGIKDTTFSTFDKSALMQLTNYFWPEIIINNAVSYFDPNRQAFLVDLDFSS
jgi:hypothetical protein